MIIFLKIDGGNVYFRCKMESEIKSFLKNIGNECLSDLINFGKLFSFLILYLKGSFVLKMKVGHSLYVFLLLTACFFLKESKAKSVL